MKTQVCIKCGEEKTISDFYYHRMRKCYMATCKSCNTKICGVYQKNVYQYREEYIFYQRAYQISRDKVKYKKLPCDENLRELLHNLWQKQEHKCAYTGRLMSLRGYQTDPNAMTVDRIDPVKGYVAGNIVLCCGIVNRIKQNLSLTELFSLIEEMKEFKKER